VAEINEAIFVRLHGPLNIFYFIDSIKQNKEGDYIELLPVELLQTFNSNNLPPLKLSLKVGAPVILLRNLYFKEGLYNGTRIVVTHLNCRCIKA